MLKLQTCNNAGLRAVRDAEGSTLDLTSASTCDINAEATAAAAVTPFSNQRLNA